jgi:hypothetical protein
MMKRKLVWMALGGAVVAIVLSRRSKAARESSTSTAGSTGADSLRVQEVASETIDDDGNLVVDDVLVAVDDEGTIIATDETVAVISPGGDTVIDEQISVLGSDGELHAIAEDISITEAGDD